jgi:hypothetical protein
METWLREDGDAPQPQCPTCGAAEGRSVAYVRPIVYLRCRHCETAWGFRDRRQARRVSDAAALDQFPSEAGVR